jgi:hypothetical protein
MENYIGKIVFVEEANTKSGGYRDGEYVIVNQSPNNLFGISTRGGLESHEIKALPLVGEKRYNIVSVSEDFEFLQAFVENLENFAKERNSPGKQWISSVYDGALSSARMIRRLLEKTPECPERCCNKKMTAFREALKPLEEFVNKYCCPHDIIVIEQGHVSIYSGEMAIPLKLLD